MPVKMKVSDRKVGSMPVKKEVYNPNMKKVYYPLKRCPLIDIGMKMYPPLEADGKQPRLIPVLFCLSGGEASKYRRRSK